MFFMKHIQKQKAIWIYVKYLYILQASQNAQEAAEATMQGNFAP